MDLITLVGRDEVEKAEEFAAFLEELALSGCDNAEVEDDNTFAINPTPRTLLLMCGFDFSKLASGYVEDVLSHKKAVRVSRA